MKTFFDFSKQSPSWYHMVADELLKELAAFAKDKSSSEKCEKQRVPSKVGELSNTEKRYMSRGMESLVGLEVKDNFDVDDTAPRLVRGEFLEQRINRRNSRQNNVLSTPTSVKNGDGDNIVTEIEDNAIDRFPEKLSEIYARDSRRYDGAFERY